MAINNPYIPGDPYSYDLKWIVAKVKEILQQLGTLDEAIEAKIFEGFLEHSIVQFKTVAEMLAADITDGSIVLTLGYHEAGDQGGLFYLVKDFNPSQCALDYFLTLDNNRQIAIPVVVTDYVNPIMFGAMGDGSADDTLAVTTAMKYLDENRKILFPNVEKGYYITTPITIDKPDAFIEMRSPVWYRGTGAAITINTYHVYGNFMIQNGAGGTEYFDAPAGSVGLKLLNADENTIEISSIYGFETGLQLEGNGDGTCYNNIDLNVIGRCKTGVYMNAEGIGWVNENKFFGGNIWVATSDPFKSSCIGFDLKGTQQHFSNANIIFGTCLEGMYKAVQMDHAMRNRFYSVRTEACTYALYATASYLNEVTCSLGNTDTYSEYASNIVTIQSTTDDCYHLVCDSGDLASNLVYNTSANFFKNGVVGMFDGTVNLASQNQITRHDEYISIDGARYVASKISTHTQKKFRLSQYCVDGGTCRPFIAMFDGNGTNITSGIKTSAPAEMLSASTAFGATVFSPSSDWVDFAFEVPAACEYLIIGYRNNSGSANRITNYKIYSNGPRAEALPIKMSGLPAIPTSPAIAGDICPDRSGATNGWRYTGSAWTAI